MEKVRQRNLAHPPLPSVGFSRSSVMEKRLPKRGNVKGEYSEGISSPACRSMSSRGLGGERMITASKDSIFRKQAVEKYLQNREKSILPRFVAPPVFLFCWCLLALLLCAGLLTWFGQVPVYVPGAGMVLYPAGLSSGGSDGARALIFVPYSSALHLHAGQHVQLQLAGQASQLTRAVETVDRTILSPSEVRQRYQFVISQPGVAITVDLGSRYSARVYAGSVVLAQVEVGSRRLLSLLPGFDAFEGIPK
jgi:hypothetical protein